MFETHQKPKTAEKTWRNIEKYLSKLLVLSQIEIAQMNQKFTKKFLQQISENNLYCAITLVF